MKLTFGNLTIELNIFNLNKNDDEEVNQAVIVDMIQQIPKNQEESIDNDLQIKNETLDSIDEEIANMFNEETKKEYLEWVENQKKLNLESSFETEIDLFLQQCELQEHEILEETEIESKLNEMFKSSNWVLDFEKIQNDSHDKEKFDLTEAGTCTRKREENSTHESYTVKHMIHYGDDATFIWDIGEEG